MATIEAVPNPIVVDNTASPPETGGDTQIRYEKERMDELWERKPGAGWAPVNVHVLTGLGDEAEFGGDYSITLAPGQNYTAGVFASGNGPLVDPLPLSTLTVTAVLKKPGQRTLISDESGETGGTWHQHGIATTVSTDVVLAGASRTPPAFDNDGLPQLVDPDGALVSTLVTGMLHAPRLLPLAPGHHYFFTAMVVDAVGNWEVLQREFDTRKRRLTVKFPRIHIFNDGDPRSYGEGEFWFRVSAGSNARPMHALEEFHFPTMDIDDWSETDRPYPIGFAYIELAGQTIPPDRTSIWVSSWAIEHDGALEPDEGAGALLGRRLPLPVGLAENVTDRTFLMDCPTTTVDDDFHYGVDVNFSVAYVP